jgi:hypothetical protein
VQHFATDSNLPPRKHTPRNSYHRSIGATHLLKSVPPTFQKNHLLAPLNRCHPPFEIGATHLSEKPPVSMVFGLCDRIDGEISWVTTTFWKNPALLAIHHRSIGATHLSEKPPFSMVFGLYDRIDGEISLGTNHFLKEPCFGGNSSSSAQSVPSTF